MALRCTVVIRGMSNPFDVLTISSKAEEVGAVVPIPALPVDGNVFVCAVATDESNTPIKSLNKLRIKLVYGAKKPGPHAADNTIKGLKDLSGAAFIFVPINLST